MSETYARHIVYRKLTQQDQFRPHVSFDTLVEAVGYADEIRNGYEVKVIDLEHIDMGDMLTHPDCAALVARIRSGS
jgi:hypothetical protein